MFKTILTTTINSATANSTLFLPLSFSYPEAKILGAISANKADATDLVAEINSEFGQNNETPNDEECYKKISELMVKEKKFRFPVTLTMIVLRENGALLMLNWNGSIFLRRKDKVAKLAGNLKENGELEVKAGKLKPGDILVLANSNDAQIVEKIKENLETAEEWTDFTLFSQAYLSQSEQENLGLLIVKLRPQVEVEPEVSARAEAEEMPPLADCEQIELEKQKEEIKAIQADIQDAAQKYVGGIRKINWESHENTQVLKAAMEEEPDYSPSDISLTPIKKEEKGKPWEKISGFFKKKISE